VNFTHFSASRLQRLWQFDEWVAALALALMTLIPLLEILLRPVFGTREDLYLHQRCEVLCSAQSPNEVERGEDDGYSEEQGLGRAHW